MYYILAINSFTISVFLMLTIEMLVQNKFHPLCMLIDLVVTVFYTFLTLDLILEGRNAK